MLVREDGGGPSLGGQTRGVAGREEAEDGGSRDGRGSGRVEGEDAPPGSSGPRSAPVTPRRHSRLADTKGG